MHALQMYANVQGLACPVSLPDLLYSTVSSQPQINTPFRDTMHIGGTQERQDRRRYAPMDASEKGFCVYLPIPVSFSRLL